MPENADDPGDGGPRRHVGEAKLSEVANVEKTLPADYITDDGFGITQACRDYLQPLIEGEAYPPYNNGLPKYVRLQNIAVPKKLETKFII